MTELSSMIITGCHCGSELKMRWITLLTLLGVSTSIHAQDKPIPGYRFAKVEFRSLAPNSPALSRTAKSRPVESVVDKFDVSGSEIKLVQYASPKASPKPEPILKAIATPPESKPAIGGQNSPRMLTTWRQWGAWKPN